MGLWVARSTSSCGVLPMTAPAVGRDSGVTRSCLIIMALAAAAADLGCAHFKARRGAAEKPVATLGSELPSPSGYARSVTKTDSEAPEVAAAPAPAAIRASEIEPALAGEIVPAPEPAIGREANSSDPGVTLQPPILVDSAKVGALSTAVGVPDGARLIAGSGTRAWSSLAAQPPAVKSITRVVAEARQALDAMSTYQLALRRQERVNGTLLPSEDLIMSIRRAPKAARLTWTDGPHQGREVLYRADDGAGLMHVNMADSKIPMPRLALAPDSPMVMKNSRHPITEAGLDPLVAGMEASDQAGELTDLGMQTLPPLARPQRGVLRRTPDGEVWQAFFDPSNHLPSLVECRAANGELLESYYFHEIRPDPPELASVAAFDPDSRWGPPRGLFGRAMPRNADGGQTTTTR